MFVFKNPEDEKVGLLSLLNLYSMCYGGADTQIRDGNEKRHWRITKKQGV